MISRLTTPLVLAIAIAAIAAGCGGGSDENEGSTREGGASTISTSSLNKQEFVKEANAACGREREDILIELTTYVQKREAQGVKSEKAFTEAMRAVWLPIIEREIEAIRELGAPEGDEADVEAFIESEEKAMVQAAKLKRAHTTFQFEKFFAPSAKLAREYGLEGCANKS